MVPSCVLGFQAMETAVVIRVQVLAAAMLPVFSRKSFRTLENVTAKLEPISDQFDYVDRILVLLPSSSLRQHKDDINPNVGTLPGMVNRVVSRFQPVVVELVFISPIIPLELDFFCYCFVV